MFWVGEARKAGICIASEDLARGRKEGYLHIQLHALEQLDHHTAYHYQSLNRERLIFSIERPSNMPGVIIQPDTMENSPTARFYVVPQERVVSIEHPCIVRNFDNGVKSLGGEPQMKHVSGGVGCVSK